MSVDFESANRITSLKQGIEATTGESYADLTEGVQALKDGYGQGGKPEQEKTVEITENGTTDVLPDTGYALSKVTVNTNVAGSGDADNLEGYFDSSVKNIMLPNITAIHPNKFHSDSQINSVVAPRVVTVQDSAFRGASWVTEVTFSDELNSIGKSCFSGCQRLRSFVPNDLGGVKSIPTECFNGCSELTLSELADDVTSIGQNAFSGCEKLAWTKLPSGLVGEIQASFNGCEMLKITEIPTGVTKLNNSALRGTAIEEIAIPSGCALVGYRPLGDNVSLKKVAFLGITSTDITTSAFEGSTAIKSVTIGEGWAVSIYLNYSNNLTVESLHGMIENLADLTGLTAKNFKVGETNLAKIDEDHIAMLNAKNWNYS